MRRTRSWPTSAVLSHTNSYVAGDQIRKASEDGGSPLSGPETRYEYRAIKLLGQIGPPAKEAIPALKDWLKSTRTREVFIARAADEALESMGAAP